MNKAKREQIKKSIAILQEISEHAEKMLAIIRFLHADEQTKLENIPENLGGSEKFDAMEDAVYTLESAGDNMDEVVTYLHAAIKDLEDVL